MSSYWEDLRPHFARGGLLLASPQLDLLDAAEAMARDDQDQVKRWLQDAALRRANDEDARAFEADEALRFQFLVVQPWVLAQPLPKPAS